jgi:hypothetical protein
VNWHRTHCFFVARLATKVSLRTRAQAIEEFMSESSHVGQPHSLSECLSLQYTGGSKAGCALALHHRGQRSHLAPRCLILERQLCRKQA